MMKFQQVDLQIEKLDDEVQLLFSRVVRDVRMTPNEAERHAYAMLDRVREIRKETENAGIDTGVRP